MPKNFCQLKYYSAFLVICTSVLWVNFDFNQSSQAQTSQGFDQQKCISKLVKTGLDKNKASGWCEYQQQCLTQAQAEGLPLEVAQNLCDCSLEEFRNRYTLTKFQELNQKAQDNPDINNQLTEIGETCFEDILFGDD